MLEVPHTETHRDGVDIYDNIIPYIKGGEITCERMRIQNKMLDGFAEEKG